MKLTNISLSSGTKVKSARIVVTLLPHMPSPPLCLCYAIDIWQDNWKVNRQLLVLERLTGGGLVAVRATCR